MVDNIGNTKSHFQNRGFYFHSQEKQAIFSPIRRLLIAYNMTQLTEIKYSVKYSLHQLGNYNKIITSLEIMGHILSGVDSTVSYASNPVYTS